MTHDTKNALQINVLSTTNTWPATPPKENWWKKILGRRKDKDLSNQIRILTQNETQELPIRVLGQLVSDNRVSLRESWIVDEVSDSDLHAATKQEAYQINVFGISSNTKTPTDKSPNQPLASGTKKDDEIKVLGEAINPEDQRDPRSRFDQQWVRQQVSSVSRSFGMERFDNSHRAPTHHMQEYTYSGKKYKGQGVSSCVAASVYNALKTHFKTHFSL